MVAFDLFARTALVIFVNGLWQGALIAGAIWLALRVFPRVNASTRYAAWVLALLATAIVPVLTSIPQIRFVTQSAATTVRRPLSTVSHAPTAARETIPASKSQPQTRLTIPPRPAVHVNLSAIVAVTLFSLWALAALAMLARLGVALARLEKLKSDALPLDIDSRDRLERYREASETARNVRICTTDGIDVPVAVGLFDAMVLLPQHLFDTLDSNELDQITLHELAHLLRHDDWTNGLQRLLSALFFFNPAVWFVGRQLDVEREVACDDYVLELTGAVRSYAFCLTKMAEMTAWPHQPLAAPGVFITRKNISIRIERLLRSGRAISSAISPVIASGVVAGLIVATAIAAVVTPSVAFALPGAPQTSSTPEPVPHKHKMVVAKPKPVARKAKVEPTAQAVRVAEATATPIPAQTREVHVAAPIHVPAVAVTKMVAQAGTDCTGCDFSNGHLAGQNFSHANLTGSDFEGADLHGARFDRANASGANFSGADLRNVSFVGANLTGCVLKGAQLAGARFDGASLMGCDVSGRDLSPAQAAIFLRSCMGCNFADAHLDGIDLHGIHLTGVNLSGASLRNVSLAGARISGVNFSDVDFTGANLNGTTFMGCNFSGANLRSVDLSKTRFIGSSLSGAIMNR